MPKFRGTIKHNELEGGHYQLVADDGTAYQIDGADPALKEDGARVEVEGAVDKNAMSFAMTGPILKVKSVKRI